MSTDSTTEEKTIEYDGVKVTVTKRDGSKAIFDEAKIAEAISRAAVQVGEDISLEQVVEYIDDITETVVTSIMSEYTDEHTEEFNISVEEINDIVEEELMKSPRRDIAKAFILYRQERVAKRERPWVLTDLQKSMWESKYKYCNENIAEFLTRVSGDNKEIRKLMEDKMFLPAGRIMTGRGTDRKQTYSNCYVLPMVEDNLESIFESDYMLGKTCAYGGGVGLDISNLRPKGTPVNNAAKTSSGAVSFMSKYNNTTKIISQFARRGALMISLDVNHPDIEDFLDIKKDLTEVTAANISVRVSDKFMQAVIDNEDKFPLIWEGKVIATINPRKILTKLASNNWEMAEPGMLFWDTICNYNLLSEDKEFKYDGVNPCGEEPLPGGGSCLLGSINLSELVLNAFKPDAYFDFAKFDCAVRKSVTFLNEILDEGLPRHPLQIQRDTVSKYRQIGLGTMGLADAFIKMGIKYGAPESISLIHRIGKHMINAALQQSALLAKEYGTYPKYNREAVLNSLFLKDNATPDTYSLVEKYGLRNSQLLTCAPTGSISNLIGVSGGIEPIFAVSYSRKTETLHGENTYYKIYTPVVKELMEALKITEESELPEYVVTAHDIDYKNRLEVQSALQQYVDASISSTVNVPNSFTVEEVENLYIEAWKLGLKGVTIYRDGCARQGILEVDKSESTVKEVFTANTEATTCPNCGAEVSHTGGCVECICGWSKCSL